MPTRADSRAWRSPRRSLPTGKRPSEAEKLIRQVRTALSKSFPSDSRTSSSRRRKPRRFSSWSRPSRRALTVIGSFLKTRSLSSIQGLALRRAHLRFAVLRGTVVPIIEAKVGGNLASGISQNSRAGSRRRCLHRFQGLRIGTGVLGVRAFKDQSWQVSVDSQICSEKRELGLQPYQLGQLVGPGESVA